MPSNTDPKTILLVGTPTAYEATSAASTAITPGKLLEVTSDGEVQEHSTAGGNAQVAFARAEDYAGGGIDTAYAVGDNVAYYVGKSGDRFYAYLANTENVAIGDLLESDGNGDLQAHTPASIDESGAATTTIYTQAARFKAIEALNNTTGSPARIKIEVL